MRQLSRRPPAPPGNLRHGGPPRRTHRPGRTAASGRPRQPLHLAPTTAARWMQEAGGDWTRYAAEIARTRNHQP